MKLNDSDINRNLDKATNLDKISASDYDIED